MDRSRNYTFTWNNYGEDAEKYLRSLGGIKYIVGGYEVGESGTPHIQGFMAFTSARTLSAVIKLLPGCHVEVAIAPPQAVDYCKKDGKFFEIGTPLKSRKEIGATEKERWSAAVELAKKGDIESIDADIQLRFYRTLKEMKKDYMVAPESRPILDNTWIYGPSGSGKSLGARLENPGAYYKQCNKWWDGYTGQDTVIIEDFDKSHGVLGHHLKIWADHGAFIAETKGGAMMIRPKKIVLTSNYCPGDIWEDGTTLEPLLRRFELVYKPLPIQ